MQAHADAAGKDPAADKEGAIQLQKEEKLRAFTARRDEKSI
jgi:hypothetical protein